MTLVFAASATLNMKPFGNCTLVPCSSPVTGFLFFSCYWIFEVFKLYIDNTRNRKTTLFTSILISISTN
jgi:hypothetical protein